jgi:hypothetical protein
LLLFVLLSDRASHQGERTANQYGYNFFHVTSFVESCLLFIRIHLRVLERVLIRGMECLLPRFVKSIRSGSLSLLGSLRFPHESPANTAIVQAVLGVSPSAG